MAVTNNHTAGGNLTHPARTNNAHAVAPMIVVARLKFCATFTSSSEFTPLE
eukprot:CAMPEP_0183730942 /NCGR_PEP_ID=MMETSP0737-20130205/33932_1 /TAXON_ID=385413 /ORGANISM="Thalassiosira miniscula, Strain CCMP1093" /LENGTH=50 /DNA_ID=CAMNT_0025963547 /DNA_START=240 /DNA_END=392 /DNA_ORIENTATION=+